MCDDNINQTSLYQVDLVDKFYQGEGLLRNTTHPWNQELPPSCLQIFNQAGEFLLWFWFLSWENSQMLAYSSLLSMSTRHALEKVFCASLHEDFPKALLMVFFPSLFLSCWLNPDKGFHWSFLGPVCAIIVVGKDVLLCSLRSAKWINIFKICSKQRRTVLIHSIRINSTLQQGRYFFDQI